jgi:tRNA-dihydrouridine synthase
VVANGDIDTPRRRATCCAHRRRRVMIGRAAQGRPWIFREIAHFLATGSDLRRRWWPRCSALLLDHLQDHYACTANSPACAARASTSAGTCARCRAARLPRAHEHDRGLRAQLAAVPTSSTRWRTHGPHARAARGGAQRRATSRWRNAMSKKHIEECVRASLEGYFRDLRGTEPDGMYEMLVKVVEKPLLEW